MDEMVEYKPLTSNSLPPPIQHQVSSIKYPATRSRPFIIPVFLPGAGCPHRCAFCNQRDVTGVQEATCTPETLRRTVHRFLAYKGPHRSPVQIAFYGGNFLGLEKETIQRLLAVAREFVSKGQIDTIRFSTRPDTIQGKNLELLRNYPVSTIEIGAQSMNDTVLARCERGHTAADTEQAVSLLRERGFEIGVQMMVGLPGDNNAGATASALRIADLAPDFVRIYPTVVLRHSLLARWYRNGDYTPLPLESCVTLVKELYLLFTEKRIPVIRMGLQGSDNSNFAASLLAGPFHPAFGHLVYSEIFLDRATSVLGSMGGLSGTVTFRVHPRSVSRLRGQKNRNIDILKRKFHLDAIRITTDPSLGVEELTACNSNYESFTRK